MTGATPAGRDGAATAAGAGAAGTGASRRSKWMLAAGIGAAIAAFFAFGLHHDLSLETLVERKQAIDAWRASHQWLAAGAYFTAYVGMAALSLPGATALTLAGGAIFGLPLGLLLASFASASGATLAMLSSRWLLRDWAARRLGARLQTIDQGIAREGPFYLFALRLVPVIPFFVINLAMGITTMRIRTFYWVSQLGMLAGTAIYVYAGTELGRFHLSWDLAAALTLLGLFPLLAHRALDLVRRRRRWPRPPRFDYNVVVIGAGSAGLVSAYIAAAVRARVALVERARMGGDCLNTGCVPSKALIQAARLRSRIARSAEFGLGADAGARAAGLAVDFGAVMQRVARVVRAIEPHDSVQRYTALGVECIAGRARITSPWTVQVEGDGAPRTLTTRAIVVASGAEPFVPPIPGLSQCAYLTSETVWDLRELPRRLLVLGAGAIGCELAQAFARLGCEVTQVEMLPRVLAREDDEVSERVAANLRRDGVRLLLGHRAREFLNTAAGGRTRSVLVAEHETADGTRQLEIEFDRVLVAAGRRPRTADLGLEALGIGTNADGTIQSDRSLRTACRNITVCGDVAGPYQFTHAGANQAWYATVNALFGRFKSFRLDESVLPWCTFVDPEVARVGVNEREAAERGLACDCTIYRLDDLDRAIIDGETDGFVKVLTARGSDRILGVTIMAAHAAEMLPEFVLAMKNGLGLSRILGAIHPYPTLSEANKYAAGNWRRSRVTRGQWDVLEALQAWLRGQAGAGMLLARLPRLWRDRRPVETGADRPLASPPD